MDKLEVTRRQLGTALQLYLEERDPVSVHSLACAGCALADGLAGERGCNPVRFFVLEQRPGMDDRTFFQLRNRFWNAFKHHATSANTARQDDALLKEFTDAENRDRLFLGWIDYGQAAGTLPIEAQVFNTWYLALDRSRFQEDEVLVFLSELETVFPGLADLSPDRQHQRLRRAVRKFKSDRILRDDPLTDKRPLVLGRIT